MSRLRSFTCHVKFNISYSSGPLVRVQHLLDPERGGRGPGRERHPRVRLEGRVRGGLLVVHRQVHLLRGQLAAQHGARRRRRRHAPPRQEVQLHLQAYEGEGLFLQLKEFLIKFAVLSS